jgi:hypothetical protein
MSKCDEDAVFEAIGTPSCEPTSVTVHDNDSCGADLTCLQDATVDGHEIVAEGRLMLSCARVEQGASWWCSCASEQQTARFLLGAAEADAAQACGQAPAGCLENLTVHLGPTVELVSPPYPLP